MVRTAALGALLLALAPVAAQAQEEAPDRAQLWRSLHRGDSAEQVAEALAAMPEIKRVRVKRDASGVAISYRAGGIRILDDDFLILPLFSGGRLDRLGLGTAPTCADSAYSRYTALARVLASKYPQALFGTEPISQGGFVDALLSGDSDAAIMRTDGGTVVTLAIRVTRTEPPPPANVSSKLARAASRYLWSQYDQTARECNGTGLRRVTFVIGYQSFRDFKATAAKVAEEAEEKASAARDGL